MRKLQMSTIEPPSTNTPLAHTIDSKEAVLDAAQRLINQYGFTGFSMRDLAQQSGLAKATLYHHFEDKREIFLQVLERDLTIVRDRLAAAAAVPGDLRTRLHNVAMTFFELTSERGALLLSTLRQAAGMEQEFCLLMRSYRDQLHRPIVEVLVEAMADGTIRSIDPELATMSFFGILQVFTSRNLLMADIELDEKAADFVLDFVLNGLLPTPPNEPS
jgi:TetR/AcrR family transcriptional regulator, mexJK operon transcriptional repressor